MISLVFLLLFSTLAAAQGDEADTLPPEKTQIIYDALLPNEGDRSDRGGAPGPNMTVKKIQEILSEVDIDLRGKDGQWQFFYEGMQMFLLTDSDNNRVRIMTPLAKLDQLRQTSDFSEIELLQKMMRANYLATGDVRLCMNRHILWAAFLHPLDTLTERDLVAVLGQLTQTVKKTRNEIE
jgi:hypothetical protein